MEVFLENTKTVKELSDTIHEQAPAFIPIQCAQIFKEDFDREKYLNETGQDAFLDSDNLSYPIKNPVTGEFDEALLCLSIVSAAKNNQNDIVEKAKDIYLEHCQDKRITVGLTGSDEVYDLFELLNVFI